jgi:hypothetical protein
MWRSTGETTPPSRNDLIASGIAGSFLGEALFRMASSCWRRTRFPPFWRELGAAALSPSTGFNRLAFGNRFKGVFDSHDPARYSRFAVGVSATTQNEPGTSNKLRRNEALLDYSLDYGLPGKPGYTYRGPFDYFSFQAAASSANVFENIVTRGLLYGTGLRLRRRLSRHLGTVRLVRLPRAAVLPRVEHGAVAGHDGPMVGRSRHRAAGHRPARDRYTGVATLGGTSDQDYHYGLAPQALATLRVIFGDKASLDATAREYFVSHVGGAAHARPRQHRARRDVLHLAHPGPHAVALRYLWTRRDAASPTLGDVTQSRGTFGLFYTLLGHDRFGAVDWRQP